MHIPTTAHSVLQFQISKLSRLVFLQSVMLKGAYWKRKTLKALKYQVVSKCLTHAVFRNYRNLKLQYWSCWQNAFTSELFVMYGKANQSLRQPCCSNFIFPERLVSEILRHWIFTWWIVDEASQPNPHGVWVTELVLGKFKLSYLYPCHFGRVLFCEQLKKIGHVLYSGDIAVCDSLKI